MADLVKLPIREIRRQLDAGALSCVELAQRCIDNREKYQSPLNALHQWNDRMFLDSAAESENLIRSSADSGLAGLPVTVKSVIGVAGYPCYAGCKSPLPERWSRDASFVAALRKRGATVAGITHAAELAIGGLGVNEHYPTPRNPWDASSHRIPGGSSSGAAVSLWEGVCKFALGTDTGGSVRVPASAAGAVGFKTTTERWSTDGVVPLASRFDSLGLITLSVDDLRFIFDCVDEQDDTLRKQEVLRLSWPDFNFKRCTAYCWDDLDPGIEEAIETALETLCRSGMQLQADDDGIFSRAASLRDQGPNTAAFECQRLMTREFPDIESVLSLHAREFLESGKSITQNEVDERVKTIETLRHEVHRALQSTDILVAPTLRLTPPTLQRVQDRAEYMHFSDQLLTNTVLASMNGLCALTMPVGLDSAGMPVGLQLSAKRGAELPLLQAAQLVENAIGTSLENLGLPPLIQDFEVV